MALLLRDLFEQVIAAVSDDPEGCCLEEDEFYRKLDFFGTSNPHLVNPTRHPTAGWARRRDQRLTGRELVCGDHLVFVYCSHDPFAHLIEHDSVASIEAHLLSGSGVFNYLLTYLVPFVGGKALSYRIAYDDPEGNIVIYNPYDLHNLAASTTKLDTQYPNRRVEWLGISASPEREPEQR